MNTNQTQNQNENETTVAGFKLLKDSKKYDFAAISDKAHFGNLWEFHEDEIKTTASERHQTFTNLSGFTQAVDHLPTAEYTDAMPMDGENVEAWSRFRGVRDAESKYPFGVHSEKYALIQYPSMFHPVLETVQQHDLHVVGKMSSLDYGGRVSGRCLIGNQDAVIEVLQDTGDYLLMGFRISASHDGTGAMALKPFGVRTICCNENIWGNWLPSFSLKHIGNPEAQTKKFEEALMTYLNMVPTIKEKIDAAADTVIVKDEMVLAALGAGFSPRDLAKWAPAINDWEPSLKGKEVGSLWDASNSLTAYVTHERNNIQDASRDALLQNASKLLEPEDINALIDSGREKAEELREKRRKQALEGARLSVPDIAGITTGRAY